LENSLVGMSISNCKVISLSQVPPNYTRVNQFEHKYDDVSFISIPIKSVTDTYGALFIEANDSGLLNSTVDFEILKAICNHAGEILEKIQLVTLFNNFVSVETHSGILTESTFKNRISQEVLRSNEAKQVISLALISLDKYASSEDTNKKTKIFDYIISTANQQLKPYEIIGRVKNDVIGIVMLNRDQLQAKLTLERIRQQIATQYIEFFDDKLVVTVSIGIATIRPNDTFETFTSNATVALYQAQKRTNCVQVFE
jgi:diguanylate cyclase (GGDEF)-like protein